MDNLPFLARNLRSRIIHLEKENKRLENDLYFYQSIFDVKNNSAVFNLRIKTINGVRIWVDKVLDHSDTEFLKLLDQDDEVKEWLKPIRCER
tara:strand:+ start:813 stop:1088 length:276 start_codon:yes stop_codon:yes gene_type:complete